MARAMCRRKQSPSGGATVKGRLRMSLENPMNRPTRRAAMIVACLLAHAATPPFPRTGARPRGGRTVAGDRRGPARERGPTIGGDPHRVGRRGRRARTREQLGIRSERYGPRLQDMVVADARSVWLPNLSLEMLRDNAVTPSVTFLDGVDTQVVDKLFSNVFTVNQQMPWAGGSFTAAWDGTRRTTTSFFSSFNPALGSNVRLSYTQPLLRNFAIDAGRQQVAVATTNREMPTSACAKRSPRPSAAYATRTGTWSSPSRFSTCNASRWSSPRNRSATTARGSRWAPWRRSTSSRPRRRWRATRNP